MQIKKSMLVLGAIVAVGASGVAGLGVVAAAAGDESKVSAPSAGSSPVDGQRPVELPKEPTGAAHRVVGSGLDPAGGVTSGTVSDSGN